MKNKVIYAIILFILLVASFLNILFFMRFDILTEHDLGYLFNRDFFNPEHGRYLATFLGSLVTQKIPELFNIHPNNFQPVYASSFKGFFIILMCILITNAGFIFKKEKFLNILNPAFIFTYIVVYLLLFNCFFFFENRQYEVYFNILENTVFFEYPLSILWYTILMSGLIYFWFNKKIPTKISYICLLINAFFLGISVEMINLPSLCALSILSIILLIKKKDDIENILFKRYIGIYFTYILAIIAYYIKPNDNNISYDSLSLSEWINLKFIDFIKDFIQNFLLNYSILIIVSILILIAILFINIKNKQKIDYSFFIFIGINFFSLLSFFFSVFFLGINEDSGYFYIDIFKWQNVYKTITLFYFILTLGYIIDVCLNSKRERNSLLIKTALCLITLLVFHQNLITDYYSNMHKYRYKAQKLREIAYICEKLYVKAHQNGEKNITIILPKKYEFWAIQGDTFFNNSYITNIIKINNTLNEISFSPNAHLDAFSKEELAELKFSNIRK